MLTPVLIFAQNGLPKFDMTLVYVALGAVGVLVFLFVAFISINFLSLYIQAYLAGARVGILDMVRMKLLKLDYAKLVKLNIALVKAGVKVEPQDMEAHVLSKGRLE